MIGFFGVDGMPYDHDLSNAVFCTLTLQQQQAVLNLFKTYKDTGKWEIKGIDLVQQRKSLSTLVKFYSGELDKINSDSFPFLIKGHREELKETLIYTFYILYSEYELISKYQLEAEDSTRESLRKLRSKINKCAMLMDKLNETDLSPAQLHESLIDESEKYLKFVGFDIALEVVRGIDRLMNGEQLNNPELKGEAKTVVIKGGINDISSWRSGWGLNSNLILSVLGLLPEQFSNVDRATSVIETPAKAMGYLGWVISYTVLGIDLFLVSKHTIKGPWMNEAEVKLPFSFWERFTTQFDQRKFSILNAAMGATISMVCFLWLNATELANGLLIGILVADIGLTIWRYCEGLTNNNKDKRRYHEDIEKLESLIKETDFLDEKDKLDRQLQRLRKAAAQSAVEFKYRAYCILYDIIYKLATILAFSVMYYFFCPALAMVQTTKLILDGVGAAAYFLFTLIYKSFNAGLDINKTKSARLLAETECDLLLARFKELNQIQSDDPTEANEFEKQQLYLEMKRLMGDSDYQERLITYQRLKLVHSLFINILMPALLFISLMFMPMGAGIALLAVGFVLAHLSTKLLKEPSANALPKFDKDAYQTFSSEPTLKTLKKDLALSAKSGLNFFPNENKEVKTQKDSELKRNDEQLFHENIILKGSEG